MTLTAQQKRVLDFVASCIKNNGMPPTRQEIAKHFKFANASAAQDHLTKLERRGAIKLIPNISRGIVIL